jgi:formylglycine-generating enzyme required for sulfatase activity
VRSAQFAAVALGPAILLVALADRATVALADRASRLTLRPPVTIRIGAGHFEMGSDDADVAAALALCRAGVEPQGCQPELFADEQPRHRVYVSAFRIDRTEVAQRDYARCVEHGDCPPARVTAGDPRLGASELPVAGVSWQDAKRYCEFAGGRLPTEAEWERAARGDGARQFPWGNAWNSRVANHGGPRAEGGAVDGFEHAAPVTALADGASAYGLLNLAGNVWELTADYYDREYYARSERVDPRNGAASDAAAIRGGSWRSPAFTLRVAQRGSLRVGEARPDVGFRCAYNVP